MDSSYFNDTAKGVTLGLIAFLFILSAFPIQTVAAATGNGKPYFSITMEAPSTNPSRRQWAAIIQNSWSNAGIGANLIYVSSFGILTGLVLGCGGGCPPKSFADGGFDAFFVGAGGGTALPDFGTQNVLFYKGEKPSDFPPIGSNWYWWKNDTYNQLADTYSVTFDAAARLKIAQKMVAIVAQERPGLVIDYPASVFAFDPSFKGWGTGGSAHALTATSAERDWQHWTAGTTINVAETGDIDNMNVLRTSAQNSLYDVNVWQNIQAFTEEPDGRAVAVYFNSVASQINSSADHLLWTETLKAHNFQDGVPVTSDDYLYGTQVSLLNSVGYVGEGTTQSLIGLYTQFTYLNGTTSYVSNGTYAGHTAPANWKPTSIWKSVSPLKFSFTMPQAYIFTDPLVTALFAVPKHIYEQYPTSAWSSNVLSGFTGSSGGLSTNTVTYKWDSTKYGGNGSYVAYGPVSDGPYIYKGYDPVSQTATLGKWSGYFNTTGLEALGQFTATTIHYQHVIEKAAAIAGVSNKVYNVLDAQYTFNRDDEKSLIKAGSSPVLVSDPSNGFQDLGLNGNSPIWGTGTATPLGQSNPAKAHQAALLVRKALSYLIPRNDIVNSLLQGIGAPGITEFYPNWGGDIYNGIQADPYDPTQALSFLAAAGYNTGVSPSSGTITVSPPPPIQVICTTTSGGGTKTVTISVPSFLLGNTFTTSGTFPVIPSLGASTGGFAVTLQQSLDGGKTWAPVALGQTTQGGYYQVGYAPTVTGNVWYRVFFTGVPESFFQTIAPANPGQAEAYAPPQTPKNGFASRNITNTGYSLVTQLTVGTLGDLAVSLSNGINQALSSLSNSTVAAVNNGLCNLQTSLTDSTNTAISTLSSNINTALTNLQGQSAKGSDVTALQNSLNSQSSQIGTLTDVAYAALAVSIVLGLGAIFLSRRKGI